MKKYFAIVIFMLLLLPSGQVFAACTVANQVQDCTSSVCTNGKCACADVSECKSGEKCEGNLCVAGSSTETPKGNKAASSQSNISKEVDSKIEEVLPADKLGLLTGDVPTIVGKIVGYLMGVLGTLALVMFIYAGWLWMSAGGEPKNVDKAKNIFLWSALGMGVIFGAYAITTYLIKAM